MTKTNAGYRLVLLGLVALIAALLPLSTATAAHLTGVTQLVGEDNVASAITWSDPAGFPDGGLDSGARDPQYVLIGRDDIFPDNLASGALQGANGPLLLTSSTSLDDDVVDEIERLGVDQAIILGGEDAISEAVETELNDVVSDVSRLEGETRIETAIDITRANADMVSDIDTSAGGDQSSTAILARAFDSDGGSDSAAFADSLAAGGWAADEGFGVLLTQTNTLTGSVQDYLEEGDIDDVIIVGGEQAISTDVEDAVRDMGIGVERVEGENRAGTAVAIAERRNDDALEQSDGTILVEGFADDAWASGFPAAATSALEGYPIVLANGTDLPPETEDYADDQGTGGGVTDTDTATGSGGGDLVCGPKLEGAGTDTGSGTDTGTGSGTDDNTSEDRAPACEDFAERSGAGDGDGGGSGSGGSGGGGDADADGAGTISSIDVENDTFTYEQTDDMSEVTVNYSEDDTFTIDGEPSTLEEFETEAAEGDGIEVTSEGDTRTIDLMPEAACLGIPPFCL